MSLHLRLQEAANRKGIKQNHIAEKLDISRTTVGDWWHGRTKEINSSNLIALCEFLDVSEHWLVTGLGQSARPRVDWDEIERLHARKKRSSKLEPGHDPGFELGPEINPKEINLIGWVEAGFGSEAVDPYEPGDGEGKFKITRNFGEHTYALRVKGDSMKNPNGRPNFEEGDIIIIDPDAVGTETTGSLVIAMFTDESIPMHRRVTFKQLVREGTSSYLKPLNPTHDNIYDDFEVIGVFLNQIL